MTLETRILSNIYTLYNFLIYEIFIIDTQEVEKKMTPMKTLIEMLLLDFLKLSVHYAEVPRIHVTWLVLHIYWSFSKILLRK